MKSDPADLGRLRWQCRRGMRELDELLLAFMESRGETLDAEERGLLARLLEYPDQLLLDWLMGQARPMDGDLARAVDMVRGGKSR